MKQAGLFDVRPVALARTAQEPTCATDGHVWRQLVGGKRCERCGEQVAEYDDSFAAHPALRPDVLRVIVHKSGKPNPELRDGPTGREFWIVQLKDRTWVHQFTDGSRGPATKATTDFLVEQMLAGEWREVTA